MGFASVENKINLINCNVVNWSVSDYDINYYSGHKYCS
jgi:hypothetical protein